LKWRKRTKNEEGVEAAPIPEVAWIKVAMVEWHGLEVESWKQEIFLS